MSAPDRPRVATRWAQSMLRGEWVRPAVGESHGLVEPGAVLAARARCGRRRCRAGGRGALARGEKVEATPTGGRILGRCLLSGFLAHGRAADRQLAESARPLSIRCERERQVAARPAMNAPR